MATRPAPGTRLVFRWRKWDASPHWEHDCIYLGSDEHGDWFGQFAGWESHRPGREVIASAANVTLLPPGGEWVFTANEAPHRTRVYIDLAWDARWDEGKDGGEPTGIDMDLDVVEQSDRGVWIDDRDEWDEHRVQYGYPLDIVERLESVTLDLEARVGRREAPFDDATIARWLARTAEFRGSFDDEALPSAR
ncbi:DUF402 domain-containing protein [Microbacterium sp. P07]|uniref:DUF402 domain-containing protein n=1 Tax=Microbacterium sp. P07 TaxID=3366952 RepID=UPI00374776A8